MRLASWPFGDLTPHSYGVVVADPAWSFTTYSAKGLLKSPQRHYECMTLDQIKSLPVQQLFQPDALLLLWTTGWAMANGAAHDVAKTWGATPVSEMIWRKTMPSGKVRWGTGYRVRSMHEPILVCTVGKPVFKPLPSCIDGVVGPHSQKPNEVYEIIRKHTRSLLWRCDLFSAEIKREGFEQWGESHRTEDAQRAHAAAFSKALQAGQPAHIAGGSPGSGRGATLLPEESAR